MTEKRIEFAAGACLALLLVIAWLMLARGLGGDFIFDDYYNLRGLEEIQNDPGLGSALHYAATGISSPLGRPLALATFAAQYGDWPHPTPFQRVNILLHLLTGCVVLWALVRLSRLLRMPTARGLALSLAMAGLWLMAPLQTGAVLYVVQRMAALSGLLVFVGLLLYLVGRQRLVAGRTASGLAWCSAGLAVGVGLGVLAKENAALLPPGLLALEFTLLADVPRGRAWRWWAVPFLAVPALLVAGYLAYIAVLPGAYAVRDFTLGERVLTEARVLWLYLYKLFFPSISSLRLLYDDLAVSRSLLAPATTLPSLAAWIAAVVIAVRARRAAPWLSFAILWYLAHHLLESTVLPLELAFEHRNYVAALGPIAALVWYAAALLEHPRVRRVRWALAGGYAAYAAFVVAALGLTSQLWGDSASLIRHWGRSQPDSPRAQMALADQYLYSGKFGSAATVLLRAMDRWPGDLVFPIVFLHLGCFVTDGPVPDLEHFEATAARYKGRTMATVNSLNRLVTLAAAGRCDRYASADWYALLDIVDRIPAFARHRRNTLLLRFQVAYAWGELPLAGDYLDEAIATGPTVDMLRTGVRLALKTDRLDRAHRYVELADARAGDPVRGWVWRDAARELRERIERRAAEPPPS